MRSLALEPFDFIAQSQPAEQGTYKEGFDTGFAQAQSEHLAEQGALKSEIVQALSDYQFGYAEARAEITQSLTPLFQEILRKILPRCVEITFAARVSELLEDAVSKHLATSVQIRVHPKHKSALGGAISANTENVKILEDPSLTENTVIMRQHHGEEVVNLDHVLLKVENILLSVQPKDTGQNQNG